MSNSWRVEGVCARACYTTAVRSRCTMPTVSGWTTVVMLPTLLLAAFLAPNQAIATVDHEAEAHCWIDQGRQTCSYLLRLKGDLPATAEAREVSLTGGLSAIRQQVEQGRSVTEPLQVRHRYQAFGMANVDLFDGEAEQLLERRLVQGIWLDRIRETQLDESLPLVGKSDFTQLGFGADGQDAVVAVIDTGVETGHSAFAGSIIAEACFSRVTGASQSLCPGGHQIVYGPGASEACVIATQQCGHGTHVSSIAAGRGEFRGMSGGSLVSINAAHRTTSSPAEARFFDSDVIAGLNWVAQLKDSSVRQLVAVNLSLGSGQHGGLCPGSAYDTPVSLLMSRNVAVFAATGNDGWTHHINSPACAPGIVAVGNSTKLDQIGFGSNHHPTAVALFAPGTSIMAAAPGNAWQSMTGTSMAAPHAAGALALLRDLFPNENLPELLNRLGSSSTMIIDNRPGGSGLGRPRLQLTTAAAHAFNPMPRSTRAIELHANYSADGTRRVRVSGLQTLVTDPSYQIEFEDQLSGERRVFVTPDYRMHCPTVQLVRTGREALAFCYATEPEKAGLTGIYQMDWDSPVIGNWQGKPIRAMSLRAGGFGGFSDSHQHLRIRDVSADGLRLVFETIQNQPPGTAPTLLELDEPFDWSWTSLDSLSMMLDPNGGNCRDPALSGDGRALTVYCTTPNGDGIVYWEPDVPDSARVLEGAREARLCRSKGPLAFVHGAEIWFVNNIDEPWQQVTTGMVGTELQHRHPTLLDDCRAVAFFSTEQGESYGQISLREYPFDDLWTSLCLSTDSRLAVCKPIHDPSLSPQDYPSIRPLISRGGHVAVFSTLNSDGPVLWGHPTRYMRIGSDPMERRWIRTPLRDDFIFRSYFELHPPD
jgi:hypothetical protein